MRSAFADATIVQIAHRLVSVIQSSLVVVMADGRVAEAGHPWTLLSGGEATATASSNGHGQAIGLFASMVASMPAAQRDKLKEEAREAYLRHQVKIARGVRQL